MTKGATPVAVAAASPATQTVAGRVIETPVLTSVRTDIPLPARSTSRGGKVSYDFASLTVVGASFGVTNKTREQVGATVSRENKRNKTSMPDPQNPGKMLDVYSVKYEAFTVDPKTDPDGAKVRVFRTI